MRSQLVVKQYSGFFFIDFEMTVAELFSIWTKVFRFFHDLLLTNYSSKFEFFTN